MSLSRNCSLILPAILLLTFTRAVPAQKAAEEEDTTLVTKVYRVADLVLPTPNYTFRGVFLPGLRSGSPYSNPEGAMMPGMSGMGNPGAGGFGGGGGFFAVPREQDSTAARASDVKQPSSASLFTDRSVLAQAGQPGGGLGGGGMAQYPSSDGRSIRFTLTDLIAAIHRTVSPPSWEETGGPGSIFPLGGMLIVNQTFKVHQQIQELLETLRTEGAAPRSVTIEAHWLLASDDEMKTLSEDGADKAGAAIGRDALAKLVRNNKACRAQVTCFDGQTVHVVSGNIKSLVSSLIPVVGQIDAADDERLVTISPQRTRTTVSAAVLRGGLPSAKIHTVQQAQQEDAPRRSVGYQPVVTTVNIGAMLQVTPTLSDSSIVLDLQSVVVTGSVADKRVEFKNLVSLDRLDVVTQQLMTTLRVSAGRPIIAGGMTLQPGSADAGQNQLYLVVEANIIQDDKPVAKTPAARPEQRRGKQ